MPGEPARYYRSLARHAEALFPQLEGIGWRYRWAGTFALTGDGLPHPRVPAEKLHIGLGHNGRGVAMASQMGRLPGALAVSGTHERSPFPVSAIRPMPFHSLRAIGAELSGAWYCLQDRLGV